MKALNIIYKICAIITMFFICAACNQLYITADYFTQVQEYEMSIVEIDCTIAKDLQ